ncbi:serine protease inhibitor 42Dd [Drosophila erecta]|uniref:Serpin domain-containing protein n=1 Tax=Drosophila erecta TaxID=7220 RepID=B3N728_DROER|nr:serine protease inhibitor 42Dd [Drosophila erecta]EDV59324.1 uncharacterized protein Dere_GG23463 [Drosophila erecta]
MKYLCLLLLATSVTCRFTDDFYQLLAKKYANENIISSPLSLEIALSMIYMGAGAKTAQQLTNVLGLPDNREEVAAKTKDLLTELEGREKVAILTLANRIYVNNKIKLLPQYNQVVKDSFKAEAVAIDMTDTKKAASIINKWVDDQTRGKITKIVDSNALVDVLIVVLNAIYFKGQWQNQFDPSKTKKVSFHISKQKSVPVEMMAQLGIYRTAYIGALGARVIELPYRNSSLSMVIYLPDKVDGLPELEKEIVGFPLKLSEDKVNLKLPKFKMEFSKLLNEELNTMGIRDAFTLNANFEDMVGGGVFVKSVLQKAFIEVNEEGAEAAAITKIDMVFKSASRPQPIDFIADHPFAFVIRDKKNIYFQGHFVNPE